MRIIIAVATTNAALRTFVSSKRDSVVPPEATATGYFNTKRARFIPHIFRIDKATNALSLGECLRRLANSCDGLIVLIDESYRHLAADYEDAYFIASLPEPHGNIIQNYIRSVIAPVLRHFSIFSQRFDCYNNQRIFLLPLDIFLASDLNMLRSRMTYEKMSSGFGQNIDEIIALLRNRRRPKTRTRLRTVYLFDDRPLCYRYGPEEHKIVETTAPPHSNKCWHNSIFRFGRSYNSRLHHNVDNDSIPTCVHGTFVGCHGQTFTARGESHLNVFPNGYL